MPLFLYLISPQSCLQLVIVNPFVQNILRYQCVDQMVIQSQIHDASIHKSVMINYEYMSVIKYIHFRYQIFAIFILYCYISTV